MSTIKISQLPSATGALTGAELAPIVQNNVIKKVEKKRDFDFVHRVQEAGIYNICFRNTDGADKTLSFDFIDES